MTARLSVNINDETAAHLAEQSAAQGVTMTEIVRRCVALDHLFRSEIAAGRKVLIADGDTYRELVIL